MTEKEAGKIAARLMHTSLNNIIQSQNFKKNKGRTDKNTSGEDITSLKKSRGLFRMQKDNSNELRGIAIKMPIHGFVQNYGVNSERSSGIVHRVKPNSIFYKRKAHPFKLKARDFIDEAVDRSGAVEYLQETIGQIRTDKVIDIIKFGIEDGKK